MYEWIAEYLTTYKGTEKDFKTEWQWERYQIEGKLFAAICYENGVKKYLTLKCEPEISKVLRCKYKDIIPGYYMNKEHWNSIVLNGSVPDEVIKKMCLMSYELILKALPKKKQLKIENT